MNILELSSNSLSIDPLPDCLRNDIFHFRSSIQPNNIVGFGSDLNPNFALHKALSECAERAVVDFLGDKEAGITSNGFAGHLDQPKATEAAIAELVERDVFLLTWLTKTPPYWLAFGEKVSIQNQLQLFDQHRFQTRIGICGRSNGLFVLIGQISQKDQDDERCQRTIIVTAAGTEPSLCIVKLALDLRRAACMFKSVPATCNREILKPSDHISFYLNPGTNHDIGWLEGDIGKVSFPDFPNIEDIQIESYSVLLDGKPFRSVVRATSPWAQRYFVGPTTEKSVNWKRLEQIGYSGELNYQIHPLG